MPGSDLDLDLPAQGEAFTSVLAKLKAAITAIQADLEPRIGAGALDIDTEVSMNGAPLTNVGGVRLSGGGSSVVGTLYMDEELHAVTSAGDVQITSNGTLAITALGVIGGDYGGSNPAEVTYHDSAGEYWFKQDSSTWADVFARDFLLNGTLGTVRLSVDASLAGDHELSFKTFPDDNGVLIFKPADNTYNDNDTLRADNFRAVDVDISGVLKRGDYTKSGILSYTGDIITVTGTPTFVAGWNAGLSTATHYIDMGVNGDAFLPVHIPMAGNERLKSLTIYYATNGNANTAMAVYFGSGAGLGGALIPQAATGGGTASTITSQTCTMTAPGNPRYGVWVRLSTTAGGNGPKPYAWSAVVDAT
jgi:hypothetical protein